MDGDGHFLPPSCLCPKACGDVFLRSPFAPLFLKAHHHSPEDSCRGWRLAVARERSRINVSHALLANDGVAVSRAGTIVFGL